MRNNEELLILAKTYPQPSKKHRETTCVAAVNRNGELRRVFPVPFRFMDGDQRFRKWEWLQARLTKAQDDHRPESHKIDVDTVIRLNEVISTANEWAERRRWIEPHVVESFSALEQRRQNSHQTLGIIRPRIVGLDITPVKNPEWTDSEIVNLTREGLFDNDDIKARPLLMKMPFDFHYLYECDTPGGVEIHRHMITDWEAGALFRNCIQSHGPDWEQPFRAKLEMDFSKKDLMFLMGTVHRFPDQWLIVGLIYPPMRKLSDQMTFEI